MTENNEVIQFPNCTARIQNTGVNKNNRSYELSDSEIDSIVDTLKSVEGHDRMEAIKQEVQIDPDAELIAEHVEIDNSTNTVQSIMKGDYKVVDGEGKSDADIIEERAKSEFDMSDEETLKLLDLVQKFSKDEKYPVYAEMPEPMKNMVRQIAMANQMPASQYNVIARTLLSQFMQDLNMDDLMKDFQKSLDEALNIPSIVDLYSDHTRDVMDKIIPEAIVSIREESPEKADMLEKIREAFHKGYDFSFAKEMYENNSRLRKSIRRNECSRAINEFNLRSDRNQFKMPDAMDLPAVLAQILIDEPIMVVDMHKKNNEEPPAMYEKLYNAKYTFDDIIKFCILVLKSTENMDPRDIIDSAYCYYMLKNIIVLKHTQEAKTEFSVELINNICDTIAFIRDKEAEFDAKRSNK